MKRTLLFLLYIFSAILCVAQTGVEQFFIRQGFEDVRHITDNGKEIFYLGSKAFKTDQRLINAIRESVDSISPKLENSEIDVILLNNRFPVFHMQSSRSLTDKNGKLLWRSDFHVDEKYKVLRNYGAKKGFFNSSFGKVDLLFYPQFRFKNSRLDRIYSLQININPTLEIGLWKGANLTAQLMIPILNDDRPGGYSEEESKVRPGFVTFSQEFKIPGNIFAKATIGNFDLFRAGLDLKVFKPIGERVGLYGQVGVTEYSVMLFEKWYYSGSYRPTWKVGANYFVKPWNLMFNMNIAEYLANDIAVRGEIIRYFRNAAVGFYVQSLGDESIPVNGGFFFSIALPPYTHKRSRGIRVSTARCFNLEYIARPYEDVGRIYRTAPDENSTENFFNTMRLKQIIDTTN